LVSLDRQIDAEGHTLADLLVEYLGEIADQLERIADYLKIIVEKHT